MARRKLKEMVQTCCMPSVRFFHPPSLIFSFLLHFSTDISWSRHTNQEFPNGSSFFRWPFFSRPFLRVFLFPRCKIRLWRTAALHLYVYFLEKRIFYPTTFYFALLYFFLLLRNLAAFYFLALILDLRAFVRRVANSCEYSDSFISMQYRSCETRDSLTEGLSITLVTFLSIQNIRDL